MNRFLEEPLIKYLIITSVSLICSVLLFKAGGSLAEVTGEQGTLLGFSFKAGGAVAGFIIIFALSFKIFDKLASQQPHVSINRIYVKGAPKDNGSSDNKYVCTLWLYDTDSGKERTMSPKFGWENGMLTIYLLRSDLRLTDYFKVIIENGTDVKWESETYDSRAPRIDLIQKQTL